jgi:hypothetical protein
MIFIKLIASLVGFWISPMCTMHKPWANHVFETCRSYQVPYSFHGTSYTLFFVREHQLLIRMLHSACQMRKRRIRELKDDHRGLVSKSVQYRVANIRKTEQREPVLPKSFGQTTIKQHTQLHSSSTPYVLLKTWTTTDFLYIIMSNRVSFFFPLQTLTMIPSLPYITNIGRLYFVIINRNKHNITTIGRLHFVIVNRNKHNTINIGDDCNLQLSIATNIT